MPLELDNRHPSFVADEALLERLLTSVAREELGGEVVVSVLLVTDDEIAALNEEWLGHTGPTDVISFPQYDLAPGGRTAPLPPGALLGDIVISVDTAAEQAAEFADWGVEREVALLLVHGLLHLCGYDDHERAERAAMQAREDALLQTVGLPAAPRSEG